LGGKTVSDNRPIGVFDSGVGGLTVLQALHDRLPQESTIYLGDLARCPYGTRSQQEVRRFALQIADMLAAEGIKLLVAACNTATAAAYDVLRLRYPFPVVGVIAPGAQAALRATRKGRIGVVATDGTVASGAYSSAIHELCPDATVVERSASWLVPLIERGPPARASVTLELEPVLTEMRRHDVDALILGCTHFPLVRDIFEAEIGPGITVLDSAETTTSVVEQVLSALDLRAAGPPHHRLLVTGPAQTFAERAQTMFRASPVIETVDWMLDAVS
jgi:glutamate racemase